MVAQDGAADDLDDHDHPEPVDLARLVSAMRRRDQYDHPRVQLVRVALHALEHPKVRSIRAVARARLAVGGMTTQDLALAARVLVHHPVDELADGDVAHLFDVEGPLATLFQAGRAEFADEPVVQILLRSPG